MASKEELKEMFATGKKPTGDDFAALIDKVARKGDKGDPLTFDDLTDEQKQELKGEKGDPLTFDDLTDAQKEELKGKQGPAGKDGFGTEEQYNDIISRLEALEGKE